jgi:hypothetical protein
MNSFTVTFVDGLLPAVGTVGSGVGGGDGVNIENLNINGTNLNQQELTTAVREAMLDLARSAPVFGRFG